MPAGPANKYSFNGIGAASAKLVLAALAANPGTAFLATGILGTISSKILTKLFSMLASVGLVILNIGAAKVEVIIDSNNFDNSWDSAEKLIGAIRNTGRELTKEEEKAIDDKVIESFRKFASFARQKK
jgi:hypothetical protein